MSTELRAALAMLSESLDDPGEDIGLSVTRLVTEAQAAIPSFSGLTVFTGEGLRELKFTVLVDAADPNAVATSVRIPLDANDLPGDAIFIVLYAAASGAFVDLAADVTWITGQQLQDIVIDRHQHVAAEPDRLGAVLTASSINQAIGVLLALGRNLEQAQLELQQQASTDGVDLHAAAMDIVANPPADGWAPSPR